MEITHYFEAAESLCHDILIFSMLSYINSNDHNHKRGYEYFCCNTVLKMYGYPHEMRLLLNKISCLP